MASASSSALAASITAMEFVAASALAAKALSARRSFHNWLDGAGRRASETRRSRPCGAGAASGLTSARAMSWRLMSAANANCGCPCAASLSSAIDAQVASSRCVSRPGSTTAPCGNLAIVSSSAAVAGIEPVEPAAMIGSELAASRFRSASISLSRRSAGSMRPCSARIGGQLARMNLRKLSVSSQYLSNSSGTRSSSRSQLTCRVVMSSISRARSCARANAVAGLLATSGVSPRWRGAMVSAHLRISAASRHGALEPAKGCRQI